MSRSSSSYSAENHTQTRTKQEIFLRFELSFLCRFPVVSTSNSAQNSAFATQIIAAATTFALSLASHRLKQNMGVSIAAVSLSVVADCALTLQQAKGTQGFTAMLLDAGLDRRNLCRGNFAGCWTPLRYYQSELHHSAPRYLLTCKHTPLVQYAFQVKLQSQPRPLPGCQPQYASAMDAVRKVPLFPKQRILLQLSLCLT